MKKLVYFLSASLILLGCQEEEPTKQVDVEVIDDAASDEDLKNEVVYAIPSPNEQFDLLQNLGGEVNTLFVHDLARLDDYSSTKSIALNFGIYSADAAYMMRFNQGKSVFMNYVSGLDKLGGKLGISQVYGQDLLTTIEEAQDDADLLYDISSDNYLKVYDKMLENEKSAELALILAGGWIETMHILFSTAGDFDNDFEIQESITEQRYVLENLYAFISAYEDNEDVKSVLGMLQQFLDSFETLDCQSSELEIQKEEGQAMVLFGGDSCLFTAESYNGMKSLVQEIRNTIID